MSAFLRLPAFELNLKRLRSAQTDTKVKDVENAYKEALEEAENVCHVFGTRG